METELDQTDGRLLLSLARQSIAGLFGKQDPGQVERLRKKASNRILDQVRGTFVTLHKKGALRGCIGTIESREPIWESVMSNARHAACRDTRFSPMRASELALVQIEVSVLTRPEPLEFDTPEDLIRRLDPHVDGVILEKGLSRATFLPQVWESLARPGVFWHRSA